MIAIDTNVLLYACDRRSPDKQAQAIELVESVSGGLLLWQVACEFAAASRKLGAVGFTLEQAWDRLAEFAAILPLVTPTPRVLERARSLTSRGNVQFWDAMIYAACEDAGVTLLYSEDQPGVTIEGLRIENPFA